MTNREIKKAKQKLYEINNKECTPDERWSQLLALAKEVNAPVPTGHSQSRIDAVNAINRNIHTVLQTEMMLNACVSAKESCELAKQACRWAAIAAIADCIGIVSYFVAMLCSK